MKFVEYVRSVHLALLHCCHRMALRSRADGKGEASRYCLRVRSSLGVLESSENIGLDHDKVVWAIEQTPEVPSIENEKCQRVRHVVQDEGDVGQFLRTPKYFP